MNEAKELTCDLDYKAEYKRLLDTVEKLRAQNNALQEELRMADRDNSWHSGFEAAVKLIFGKQSAHESY